MTNKLIQHIATNRYDCQRASSRRKSKVTHNNNPKQGPMKTDCHCHVNIQTYKIWTKYDTEHSFIAVISDTLHEYHNHDKSWK